MLFKQLASLVREAKPGVTLVQFMTNGWNLVETAAVALSVTVVVMDIVALLQLRQVWCGVVWCGVKCTRVCLMSFAHCARFDAPCLSLQLDFSSTDTLTVHWDQVRSLIDLLMRENDIMAIAILLMVAR